MSEVLIQIGQPVGNNENSSYCPCKISGLGDGEINYAMGADLLQALLVATIKIGTVVYSSPEAKEERLTWMGDPSHNLGLPVIAEYFTGVGPEMKLMV